MKKALLSILGCVLFVSSQSCGDEGNAGGGDSDGDSDTDSDSDSDGDTDAWLEEYHHFFTFNPSNPEDGWMSLGVPDPPCSFQTAYLDPSGWPVIACYDEIYYSDPGGWTLAPWLAPGKIGAFVEMGINLFVGDTYYHWNSTDEEFLADDTYSIAPGDVIAYWEDEDTIAVGNQAFRWATTLEPDGWMEWGQEAPGPIRALGNYQGAGSEIAAIGDRIYIKSTSSSASWELMEDVPQAPGEIVALYEFNSIDIAVP